jgi:hypothetical protein
MGSKITKMHKEYKWRLAREAHDREYEREARRKRRARLDEIPWGHHFHDSEDPKKVEKMSYLFYT